MGNAINARLERGMDNTTLLHRFRYHVGRGFVTFDDIVVDAACGVGYGSAILAESAGRVIGIDKEKRNIEDAKGSYQKPNIMFLQGNLEEIEIPSCDVLCSFETIEHLYNPKAFVEKIKNSVTKYICVSVPINEQLHKVDEDIQVIGDPTHHSIFPTPAHLDELFVSGPWMRFFGFYERPCYIAVYYNANFI